MPLITGDIVQMAYVVDDIDAAIAHWTQVLGIGPFFRFPLPLPLEWLEHHGQRVEDYDILSGAALAQSGPIQIELLVPGSAPSAYRDFLDSGRRGLHHVGIYATDYDAQMASLRSAGVKVAMEGVLPLSRFAYLDTDRDFAGTMVELIEPQTALLDMFSQISAASVDWDGLDPVRTFD